MALEPKRNPRPVVLHCDPDIIGSSQAARLCALRIDRIVRSTVTQYPPAGAHRFGRVGNELCRDFVELPGVDVDSGRLRRWCGTRLPERVS